MLDGPATCITTESCTADAKPQTLSSSRTSTHALVDFGLASVRPTSNSRCRWIHRDIRIAREPKRRATLPESDSTARAHDDIRARRRPPGKEAAQSDQSSRARLRQRLAIVDVNRRTPLRTRISSTSLERSGRSLRPRAQQLQEIVTTAGTRLPSSERSMQMDPCGPSGDHNRRGI